MTNHYCDMQNADVILTIGSNNVENHPVSSKWVQRALDNGATWIVVDPRYTRSAEMADIYCPIRSGTDIAFYGGLFNYILEHDLWQHEYVLNYTNASYLLDEEYSFDVETGIFSGFDKDSATYDAKTWHYQVESTKEWDTSEGGAYAWAKAEGVPEFTPPTVEVPKRDMTLQDPMCVFQQMKKHYSRYDLDTVSATCGMDKELLEKVYATYAATGAPDKSGTILYALGQTQHTYGAQNCRSMGILQLLLGNVGVAGGGVNALRGEPNVQGATDMGMLVANQPGYLNWPTEYGTPSLRKWCEKETYADGYYTNKPKFIVSALKEWFGADTVFASRMSHRIIGVVFVAVPLISALLAPKGVAHIFKNLFDRWDSDDKKWMMLFFPYLFMAKWIHMPDQREVKSGQRFADGMLWFAGALMGITGIILLLGTTLFDFGAGVHGVTLFLHDIGFLLIAVFGLAHIFLGAGIFQPYRGTAKLMFGDGTVSESDALYHWGHWARKEIATGENVVEKTK